MQMLLRILRYIWRLPGTLLKALVRFYQLAISPMMGRNCKFHPSCSSYMIQAIEKYGAVRGVIKGVARICRCHPWSEGGEDYP